jgi:hypothetical protein
MVSHFHLQYISVPQMPYSWPLFLCSGRAGGYLQWRAGVGWRPNQEALLAMCHCDGTRRTQRGVHTVASLGVFTSVPVVCEGARFL